MLSGRGLCDELITRPEESYRLCCVVVCDLEISRIGVPYIYDISSLRVKKRVSYGLQLCVLEPQKKASLDDTNEIPNDFIFAGIKKC